MDAAAATATAAGGVQFTKVVLGRAALASTVLDVFTSLSAVSAISLVDSAAPPAVRSRRAPPRVVSLRDRRTRRRRALSGDRPDEDAEFGGFFGNGDDGPFGGGSGGGRGWGFDRDGDGTYWGGDSASSSSFDGAMGFVYEVLCWIALSNCVHFALKKVARDCSTVYRDLMRSKVQVPALITVY